MAGSVLSIIGSIVTVAVIVIATRWLSASEGAEFPRARDGTSTYGIKWQWRTVGLVGGVFWVALSIWSWHDLSRPNGVLIAIAFVFVSLGLGLATGSVTTDQTGITKRTLWSSRSLQWKSITEIRLHKSHGGAIELRSGSQKLVIDSRFDAIRHLANEIENHTQLQPVARS
jgi:hypothetical protein